eukprot:4931590-Pyramimonas_sp.AAC.1
MSPASPGSTPVAAPRRERKPRAGSFLSSVKEIPMQHTKSWTPQSSAPAVAMAARQGAQWRLLGGPWLAPP